MTYRDFLTSLGDLNVFEAHDAAAGHAVEIDPHPALAQMRAEGPVVARDLHDVLSVDPTVMVTAQSGGYRNLDAPVVSAVSFAAVDAVLRDGTSFTQEIHRRAYDNTFGRAINTLDAPEHRRMRGLLERVFSRRVTSQWGDDFVRPLARQRVAEAFNNVNELDLVDSILFRYPAEVITRLIGLPDDHMLDFMRCAVAMGSFYDPVLAQSGADAVTDWVLELMAERRLSPPGGEVLSTLLEAEVDGIALSDEEILSFIRLLFPAGFETTFRALSNTIVGLLSSKQWSAVADDRSLLPAAIEEGLRWEPSVLGHPRWTVRDTIVDGVAIEAGTLVHAYHASANRDETRWDHADLYDLSRPRKSHSTFGFGPHICLGMHLGRYEMTEMLDALLDQAPRLRLDPAADPSDWKVRGLALRSPRSIPVLAS